MSRSNDIQHKFPEGGANLHSSHQTDGDLGPYSDSYPDARPTTPPDAGNSPNILELSSWSSSPDSGGDIETNQPNALYWSNIIAFAGAGSPSNSHYPIPFATAECDQGPDTLDPKPLSCHMCRVRFGRSADLKRHMDTAKAHNPPKGPSCPVLGCKSVSKFTRLDNFKAHYVKMHSKSWEEAENFIQEWRAQEALGISYRAGGDVM
ncbi:unnamed protein product [Tuber melanosporum]|jgi:hypothetical protein|uniref:(Perigord truffle) hypothetical protein n=1 Tax=Tuber melanosporum (strain Mel28) TaxID=656061 RepID=D5GKN1_TUBMM|nr:uncharacterized protein GSTUM_00009654001 [Tuber melanosporum]CAZ85074.1 unnamed protein product [Tuber melanosporum]